MFDVTAFRYTANVPFLNYLLLDISDSVNVNQT